jgi:hypothetical protein
MLKTILTSGQTPFSVVIVLMAATCAGGYYSHQPTTKIAIAERPAIIFQAALARQGSSNEALQAQVVEPIKAVLKQYSDAGYLVLDAARDDDGLMRVAALPKDALDITDVLRKSIVPIVAKEVAK